MTQKITYLLLFLAFPVWLLADVGPQSSKVDLALYSRVSYVDQRLGDDVTGDGSKAKPWASIIHALEHSGMARETAPVAILVSQGRYQQPTFVLRSHVELYGGFKTPGGKRDVMAFASILDGQGDRRILFGNDHARLDGFHLVDARVRGKGAAILCDGVSPVIANCVFINNRTLIPVPWSPPLIHETAHDGGAIMVLNGATPRILNNYFYNNSTECGRGGALAVDLRANPLVNNNVFANNRAGLDDTMRSSDGGAVSWFDWSGGELSGNVIVANTALGNNDAGGVFIALWASPKVSSNIFVSNLSTDDAGGLFIGGQEHRYDAPLDPYPSKDRFNVLVQDNVFVGNRNSSDNSGAMRVTMESRAHFIGNLVTENYGGMYLQRSEIVAENNTVWQDWKFVEDKENLGPSYFTGNILKGPVGPVEARVTFKGNMVESKVKDSNRIQVSDIFIQDAVSGEIESVTFDWNTCTTTLKTTRNLPGNLVNRPVRLSQDHDGGQWRVIKSSQGNELVVWGALKTTTGGIGAFDVLRTFTPKDTAPAGIGAGSL
ncbi:MAG: right-handed parallel beta-helix repeat-containing protein [Verrucomicrobiae bacterium]|nr:right-handed parallel beta-helix repeat-containing protein [Verrucomicrobiae bacterium]